MILLAAIMEMISRLLTAQIKLADSPWKDGVGQGESDRLQMPPPPALACSGFSSPALCAAAKLLRRLQSPLQPDLPDSRRPNAILKLHAAQYWHSAQAVCRHEKLTEQKEAAAESVKYLQYKTLKEMLRACVKLEPH